MHDTSTHPRRGFLAGLFSVAAVATVPRVAAAQDGGGDAWIKEVPGKNRCFFDCPQHANGFGLLHILNYLGAYAAPGRAARSARRVRSTESAPRRASRWASTTRCGRSTGWARSSASRTRAASPIRGMCSPARPRPTGTCSPSARRSPLRSRMLGDAIIGPVIPNLQKMGTKFLLCNNALGLWTLELEARGKGAAAAIDKELRAEPAARRHDRAGHGDCHRAGAGRRLHLQQAVTTHPPCGSEVKEAA